MSIIAPVPTIRQPTVAHLGFAVPPNKMSWEAEFWKALGFGRITRPEYNKQKSYWLKGGDLYIHLMPHLGVSIPEWSHVAIIPPHTLDHALERLDRMPFRIAAEEAEPEWGYRRVFVYSPCGYRVELLESAPPARWPGAPADD